jgi:anti-sigma B factor antagonist
MRRSTVPARADYVMPARLDVTTGTEVRDALGIALDASLDEVVVDCSDLEVLDAVGLGVIVGIHRRARSRGRRLVLLGVRPPVMRLLAVTRLHRVLYLERGSMTASSLLAADVASIA